MNTICANCNFTLNPYERSGLHCNKCGLIHDLNGQPEGWLISVGNVPGGLIEFSNLTPFRSGQRPLTRSQVAAIVRIAATLGISDVNGIKARLTSETIESAVVHTMHKNDSLAVGEG